MSLYGPLLPGKTYDFKDTHHDRTLSLKIEEGKVSGGYGVIYKATCEDEGSNAFLNGYFGEPCGNEYAIKFIGCLADPSSQEAIEDYQVENPEKPIASDPLKRAIQLYGDHIKSPQKRAFAAEIGKQKKGWEAEKETWQHVIVILPLILNNDILKSDMPCYLMRYFPTSLKQRMDALKSHPVDEESLLRYLLVFWKICDDLHLLHKKKLFHRDITPDNIFFVNLWDKTKQAEGWEPRIGDFGVAVDASHSLPGTFQQGGKPKYLPHDWGNHEGKCDTYALGVTMDEILGGKVEENIQKVIDQAKSSDASDWYTSAGLSAELEKLIKPRTDKLIASAAGDRLLEWIDFAWFHIGDKDKKERIQSIDPSHDVYRIPLDKDTNDFRALCRGVIENQDPRLAQIFHLETRGTHHYLIVEKLEKLPVIDKDTELISLAVKWKNLFPLPPKNAFRGSPGNGPENTTIAFYGAVPRPSMPRANRAGNRPIEKSPFVKQKEGSP